MSDAPASEQPDPRTQGGDEPPEDPSPRRERPDRRREQADDAPGEPHPRDPDMPEAPPGDLIGPGPDNPAGPGAD